MVSWSQSVSKEKLFTEISQKSLRLDQRQTDKLSRLQQNPLHKKVQIVKVGNLKNIQRKGALPISIPSRLGIVTAYAKSVEAISDTEYTWYGEFEGKDDGFVTIISKNGETYGQINIGDEIYSLKSLGKGQNILVEIDGSKYGEHSCATPHYKTSTNSPVDTPEINDNTTRTSNCSNVRVLVLYTDAADQVGDPQNDADLFIAQTNQALRNSDINSGELTLELVDVIKLNGFVEDPNEPVLDLEALQMNSTAQHLRDNQVKADIVVLLTDGNYHNGDVEGVAFTVNAGDPDYAYAIVENVSSGLGQAKSQYLSTKQYLIVSQEPSLILVYVLINLGLSSLN